MKIEYKLVRHPIEKLTITVEGMESINQFANFLDGDDSNQPDMEMDMLIDALDEFLKNYRD